MIKSNSSDVIDRRNGSKSREVDSYVVRSRRDDINCRGAAKANTPGTAGTLTTAGTPTTAA